MNSSSWRRSTKWIRKQNLVWRCTPYLALSTLFLSCSDTTSESNNNLDMNMALAGQFLAGTMIREITSGEMASGEMTSGEITSGEMASGEMASGEMQIAGSYVSPPPPECDQLTLCGETCTDVQSDPINCGGCGRTCIIPNASALCIEGQCVIDSCDLNYVDVDSNIANGCETFDDCIADQSCLTSCGSMGLSLCNEAEFVCEPPPESCNLADDDCDGACDEDWAALGCRVSVHRGYGQGEHIYSTNLALVSSDGHNLERENYFYLYQEAVPNARPVFYCETREGRPFLSNQTDCGINRAPLNNLGFWLAAPTCGASPLYHLKNAANDFFYTTSSAERDSAIGLGYTDQGVVGYIWLP